MRWSKSFAILLARFLFPRFPRSSLVKEDL